MSPIIGAPLFAVYSAAIIWLLIWANSNEKYVRDNSNGQQVWCGRWGQSSEAVRMAAVGLVALAPVTIPLYLLACMCAGSVAFPVIAWRKARQIRSEVLSLVEDMTKDVP